MNAFSLKKISRRQFFAGASLLAAAMNGQGGPFPLSCGAPRYPDFLDWSAVKLAKAIRDKALSSEEVVHAYLCRIQDVHAQLNAVVQLPWGSALASASAADAAIARSERVGPLHGVPMTIKDAWETAEVASTSGTKGRANFVPQTDATIVARLKAAGAILVGKTNTPELATLTETYNLVYGRSSNPFDLARTPGGSSGGAAAIVAVSGSPFDVGSDFGGSVRIPSAFCGIAGLKPTSYRLSNAGHLPFVPPPPSRSNILGAFPQPGPMARYVEDLSLILPLLVGMDSRDGAVRDMPLGDPKAVDLKKLRVAFHTNNGIRSANAEVAAVVRLAASAVADYGLQVVESRPSALAQAPSIFFVVAQPEGGKFWREQLAAAGTTPSQATSYFQSFLNIPPASDSQLASAMTRWEQFKTDLLGFMANNDVILSPAWATPAPLHGQAANDSASQSFSYAYNLAGWPAAVVRCGTSSDGLPIAVQIISAPWREDIVLAVAAFLEAALGGWQRVPPPRLDGRRIANTLELRWKGYGTLQQSTDLNKLWLDVSEGRSPYRVPEGTTDQQFFRVRQ